MSDETRHDGEWLAPDPHDASEVQRADELGVFVAALMRREARISGPDGDSTAQLDSLVAEEWLASRLIVFCAEILPDDEFAAGLQAQIEQRIRDGGGNRRGTDGLATGGDGRRRGNS